ncbi:putative PCL7 [Coleophoma cylindrospora]|uniref:Putative PCL7 n=1 Tax=Coleophoma cylindrospora TaxID=1849047 RepID=A0A3D8QCP4_9HELO|nr:putative PCL7 [Coleophoma cylindrospora]
MSSPTTSAPALSTQNQQQQISQPSHIHDSADSFFILPPPPNPSSDAGLAVTPGSDSDGSLPSPNSLDVFTLTPVTALKLLCAGIEALCRITGDVPPTPPPSFPTTPNMRGMQAEKENIARSNSYTNLSNFQSLQPRPRTASSSSRGSDDIDGVSFRKTPIGSPEIKAAEPYIIIGEHAEPLNIQHGAITRKFYSKHPPPISVEDYLMRIHKFCPMSTAVYLTTSFYIHKLAVEERAIPVTRRNCHRLLLAGLRVAMKALEDLSYPHSRFSKVGGVSESELARLEISFCFLTNFELRTTKDRLLDHAISLKEISSLQGSMNFVPKLPLKMQRRVNVQETVMEICG